MVVIMALAGVAGAAEFDFKALTAEPEPSEVNHAVAKKKAAASDTALPYLKLDIERQPYRPGWVVSAKLGVEWIIAKGGGMSYDAGTVVDRPFYNRSTDFNQTNSGIGGEIGIGWNFGPRWPVTLGINFGMGPASKLESRERIGALPGGSGQYGLYDLYSYQKISVYTFDFSFDYNFRNQSKWTPFVGAIAGVALVSDKGHTNLNPSTGNTTATWKGYGSYGTEHRINFMAGARAGVKYDFNECIQFSFYGSYTYLGKSASREYDIYREGSTATAASYMGQIKTNKANLHGFDIKAGVRVMF